MANNAWGFLGKAGPKNQSIGLGAGFPEEAFKQGLCPNPLHPSKHPKLHLSSPGKSAEALDPGRVLNSKGVLMKVRKLSLSKENLLSLTDDLDVIQGGMVIDTSRTGTFTPTTNPKCIETSVSICRTNCGCKWTN
jgi:hypothetical protein